MHNDVVFHRVSNLLKVFWIFNFVLIISQILRLTKLKKNRKHSLFFSLKLSFYAILMFTDVNIFRLDSKRHPVNLHTVSLSRIMLWRWYRSILVCLTALGFSHQLLSLNAVLFLQDFIKKIPSLPLVNASGSSVKQTFRTFVSISLSFFGIIILYLGWRSVCEYL